MQVIAWLDRALLRQLSRLGATVPRADYLSSSIALIVWLAPRSQAGWRSQQRWLP